MAFQSDSTAARSRPSQPPFEFGEDLLDRIEVGTVGRQVAQQGACLFDGLFHAPDLVRGEVVHNDDVAPSQLRSQHLLHLGHEGLGVDGTIEHAWRRQVVLAQCAHEGGGAPVATWRSFQTASALERAPARGRHVRGGPRLFEKDQPARWQSGALGCPRAACGRYVLRTSLLAGMEGLFPKGSPSRLSTFHSVVIPTRTPCSRLTSSHSCANVWSDAAST